MGCDIHPAIEVHRKGIWRYHRPTLPCRWYSEIWTQTHINSLPSHYTDSYQLPVVGTRRNTWDRCKTRLPDFFADRNYAVFALLADVRNDYGIHPIQADRGLPDGVSREAVAKLSNEHSQGWVDLSELLDYGYDQELLTKGLLEEKAFLALCGGKVPDTWDTGLWSVTTTTDLNPLQYSALYESPIDLLQGNAKPGPNYTPSDNYRIRAQWTRPLRPVVSTVPDLWVPYLEKLIPKGGTTDDVRVVFDFDS